jgi:hypothetical protein
MLLVRGRMSSLNEKAPEPGIAFACFASTFRMARTDPSPGGQMSGSGKWLPRRPDLGEDANGCTLTNAGKTTEPNHSLCPVQCRL